METMIQTVMGDITKDYWKSAVLYMGVKQAKRRSQGLMICHASM